MASAIEEQPPYISRRLDDEESEYSLREWSLRSQKMIGREIINTKSRRFSGSHHDFRSSFRSEDMIATASFRSNFTISSTASSPGYSLREEIDPSTYSFTTALKALQAKSWHCNSWECVSPEGLALNSKWNEAEKYICNPLSGEVPLECLSAKTLSGRSFRSLTNRISVSAPLIYNSRKINSNSFVGNHDDAIHCPIQEKKVESTTRDVGTQSTPPELSSSSSPSAASTPPITERSLKRFEPENGDSPSSNARLNVEEKEVQVGGKEETTKRESNKEEGMMKMKMKMKSSTSKKEDHEQMWRCSSSFSRSMQGGCLSWIRKRHREKHK